MFFNRKGLSDSDPVKLFEKFETDHIHLFLTAGSIEIIF